MKQFYKYLVIVFATLYVGIFGVKIASSYFPFYQGQLGTGTSTTGYVLTSTGTGANTVAQWEVGGAGSMVYPSGSGIPIVSSGTSWGTTLGYGASNTGSYLVQRDASGNSAFNNVIITTVPLVSSATPLVMTYGSPAVTRITGTSTQKINLPDATYLYNGEQFQFDNDSTGLVSIYKNDGTTLVTTVGNGGYTILICVDNSTTNGVWTMYQYLSNTTNDQDSGLFKTGTLGSSALTASKVVFSDANKNLTSTGIGTSTQFLKGDGSLDSTVYVSGTPWTGMGYLLSNGTVGLSADWNAGAHTITATTFSGALSGNAATATKATNIAGGLGGSLPYQSAVDTTQMLANGSAGQILRSAGTTLAPTWSTPTFPNTATLNHLMIGDGTNWTDAAVPTWNQNTSGTATYATNVATTTKSDAANYYLTFVGANSSSNQGIDVGGATYNPSTGTFTATTFSGALSGNAATASNLSGTPLLPTGTTAHTYSQGDNSTNISTTAYVDTGLGTKAATGQTMYIGTTAQAINRASASEGLSGITSLTPGADFSLTQNSVNPFTSYNSGATANTLVLNAGNVGIGTTSPSQLLHVSGGSNPTIRLTDTNNASGNRYAGIEFGNTYSATYDFTGEIGSFSILGNNYTPNGEYQPNAMLFQYVANNKLIFVNMSGATEFLVGGVQSTNRALYIDTNKNVYMGLNNGNVGIGTTAPTTKLTVAGHSNFTGTIPTISSCGTSPAIATNSTDSSGEITEGSVSTGCTITFATAYTNAPFCTVTEQSGLAGSYTISNTAITITNIGALSSTKIDYMCSASNA